MLLLKWIKSVAFIVYDSSRFCTLQNCSSVSDRVFYKEKWWTVILLVILLKLHILK
jgi:hypothetical protein